MYRPRTGWFISQKLSTHPSGSTSFLKMKCNYLVLSFTNVGQIRGGKGGEGNYSRCIRLDGPAAKCSGRPKLPRQFVPVRNFEPRLFVPMPGNMGRPAFTFINLYIYIVIYNVFSINQNIHLDYVCIYFLIRKFVCLFVCWQAH